MLKKIIILMSLIVSTNLTAKGKDGKDYFAPGRSAESESSISEDNVCNLSFVITRGKDGKDYFVLSNGTVFSSETYPCIN